MYSWNFKMEKRETSSAIVVYESNMRILIEPPPTRASSVSNHVISSDMPWINLSSRLLAVVG